MKVSQVFTGLLIASVTTSKNQAEAGLTVDKFVAGSRGVCTGAISTGVRNIISGLYEAKEGASTEYLKSKNVEASQNKTQHCASSIAKKAMRHFPISFGATAVATIGVDKLFGVTRKANVKNIKQLALPIASMGITKEILRDTGIPQQAKDALAYSAFWAGRLAQGKDPLTAAVTVSGFAAGASLLKSFGNAIANTSDLQQNTSNESITTQGVSTSAASGFMAPESCEASDKAAVDNDSYDNYIKERYRINKEDHFYPAPDGSLFVPISDKEYKHLSR